MQCVAKIFGLLLIVGMFTASGVAAESLAGEYVMPANSFGGMITGFGEQEAMSLYLKAGEVWGTGRVWTDSPAGEYIYLKAGEVWGTGRVWTDSPAGEYTMPANSLGGVITGFGEQDGIRLVFNTEEARNVWRELMGRRTK